MNLQFRTAVDLNETPSPFDLLRCHMIRLGRRFQAAQALLTYGPRLPELCGIVNVSPVETPPASQLPPPDMSTDFNSIVRRMLPNQSCPIAHQSALSDMVEKHDLFQHFLHNYNSGKVKQYVHAEVQVLDLFYARDFMFVNDDNFIASSKPACLSCWAYFRSHPGRFVEPVSERKICLTWRPAAIEGGPDTTSNKVQASTMNDVNKFMRKEVLHQILRKSSIPSGRPGFPHIASDPPQMELSQKPVVYLKGLIPELQTLINPQHWLGRRNKESGSLAVTNVPKRMSATVEVDTRGNRFDRDRGIKSISRLCPEVVKTLYDSDSEGGVTLPLREMRW
ncbi:hypothetical protein E8E11_002897 [Didymella keratinophila]|nr:hypothetical protein E8E11_002897 [Didymella keratinophila]